MKENTETIMNYVSMLRSIDTTLTISEQWSIIAEAISAIKDKEQREKAVELNELLGAVTLACRRCQTSDASDKEQTQTIHLKPEHCHPEFLYFAKELVKFNELNFKYGPPGSMEFIVIAAAKDKPLTLHICDDCRPKFDHRCHGMNARIHDEATRKPCECISCRERDLLLSVPGAMSHADIGEILKLVAEWERKNNH